MNTGAILIVDDSDAEMALTMRAIKKSGIKADILTARGGYEALDLLLGPVENDNGRERDLPSSGRPFRPCQRRLSRCGTAS